MNISLSKSTDKKRKAPAAVNVLGDDSSSDDEDVGTSSSRAVNQALRHEQLAVRDRSTQEQSDIYDYDGVYDEMQQQQRQQQQAQNQSTASDDKRPRYMQDLLQKASERKLERELVRDRQIAREQAAEGFDNEPKFVTRAYQQKLEERQAWLQKEASKKEKDVTKSTMASFYGNLSRNVAMGGEPNEKVEPQPAFLDGFDRAPEDDKGQEAPTGTMTVSHETTAPTINQELETEEIPTKSMRQLRREKLAQAKIRYFQRNGSRDRFEATGIVKT